MIVTAYEIELLLLDSHHLKDKRRILKSLIQRGQQRFGLSLSEVANHDQWNKSTIGVAIVSNSSIHNDKVIHRFLDSIEEWYPIEIIQMIAY